MSKPFMTHQFAWDGFSFQVPHDWNLSSYGLRPNVSRIKMEDDEALRLEMEWIRTQKPINRSRLHKRWTKAAKELAEASAETAVVEDVPEGWKAAMYAMPEGRYLVTAYRLVPDCPLFCFFQIHFQAASRREPPRMIRQIASSFQTHDQGAIPWELYDIAFRLDREFRLVNTSFQVGRKLMVFEWRRRRLHIWFFSLADIVLKKKPMEEWAAEFLNSFKGIKGSQFKAGRHGEIISRFTWRYPFGYFKEISRMCFSYRARCAHIPEKNQIVLYVFNYRKDSDLEKIAKDLPDLNYLPQRPCLAG